MSFCGIRPREKINSSLPVHSGVTFICPPSGGGISLGRDGDRLNRDIINHAMESGYYISIINNLSSGKNEWQKIFPFLGIFLISFCDDCLNWVQILSVFLICWQRFSRVYSHCLFYKLRVRLLAGNINFLMGESQSHSFVRLMIR